MRNWIKLAAVPAAGIAAVALAHQAPTPAAALDTILIAKGSDWSFYTPTGAPAGDWKRGAGSKGWQTGPTSIGYDKRDVRTVFPAFAAAKAKAGNAATVTKHGDHTHSGEGMVVAAAYPMIHYRRTFEYNPATRKAGQEAIIGLRCDDACVVFVNGKEAVRAHLPEGPVKPYNTIGIGKSEFHPFIIKAGLLKAGKNNIAIEVYNSAKDDYDHAFNVELKLATPPVAR